MIPGMNLMKRILDIGHSRMEDWWTITDIWHPIVLQIKHSDGTCRSIYVRHTPLEVKVRDPRTGAIRRITSNQPDSWEIGYQIRPWDLMCLDSAATMVVHANTGDVLALNQPDGTVVLPGGKAAVPEIIGDIVHVPEYPLTTAVRELCEETGIDATVLTTGSGVTHLGTWPDGHGRSCAAYMVVVDGWRIQLTGQDFPEGEPVWVPVTRLVEEGNRYRDWYTLVIAAGFASVVTCI
jgi:8-oxo-dGTP pyrophosphatase MutT (NUDIX family)